MGSTSHIFDAETRRHDFRAAAPPSGLYRTGEPPVVGSRRDASERRVMSGFEVEPGGFLSGELRAGITNLRPRTLASQRTRATVGSANLNWRLGGRLVLTTGFDRDLYFSIYGRNLYFTQDHTDVESVFYLNRIFALEAGYEDFGLLYPRVGPPEAPLFDERRRDEIRKLKGGLRTRLTNRTVATIRVTRRRRTSNIPGAEDRQILVTAGVETNF